MCVQRRTAWRTTKQDGLAGYPASPSCFVVTSQCERINSPCWARKARTVHGSVAKAPTRGARMQLSPSSRCIVDITRPLVSVTTCREVAASTGVAKVAAVSNTADRSFDFAHWCSPLVRGSQAGFFL